MVDMKNEPGGQRLVVRLKSDGLIVFDLFEVPGDPQRAGRTHRLSLLKGLILSNAQKGEQGCQFEIGTAAAVAVVPGRGSAEFRICCHGKLAVSAGRVEVTHQGIRYVVESDQCFVPENIPPVGPTPLTEASPGQPADYRNPPGHLYAPAFTGDQATPCPCNRSAGLNHRDTEDTERIR